MKSIAIVAPDTDSGKTVVSAALLAVSKKINGKSMVMKPVQTGSDLINGRKVSPDLSTIEKLCNFEIPRDLYHYCTPYLFMNPCSPHLAARKEIAEISIDRIQSCLVELHMRFHMTIVETAGGILSPLSSDSTNADLLQVLGIPIVMVVVNRIGAISASLSAIESARAKGLDIKGIVFVDEKSDPTAFDQEIYTDNTQTIASFTGITTIVQLPRVENLEDDFYILTSLIEPFAKEIFSEYSL